MLSSPANAQSGGCYTCPMKRSIQEVVELVIFGLIVLLVGTGLLWLVGWLIGLLGSLFMLIAGFIWRLLWYIIPAAIIIGAVYFLVKLAKERQDANPQPATGQGYAAPPPPPPPSATHASQSAPTPPASQSPAHHAPQNPETSLTTVTPPTQAEPLKPESASEQGETIRREGATPANPPTSEPSGLRNEMPDADKDQGDKRSEG
jgi:hypothetical protein